MLDLKQSTSLVMTPQLRLAIKLLQLSNQKLSTLVAQEMEQNPFLSTSDDSVEISQDTSQEETDLDFASENDASNDLDSTDPWADLNTTSAHNPDDDFSFESTLTEEKTLRMHLLEQFNTDIEDPKKRLIGAYLIDSLTPAGYLEDPVEEIAKTLGTRWLRSNVSSTASKNAILQGLGPGACPNV